MRCARDSECFYTKNIELGDFRNKERLPFPASLKDHLRTPERIKSNWERQPPYIVCFYLHISDSNFSKTGISSLSKSWHLYNVYIKSSYSFGYRSHNFVNPETFF